MTNNNVGEECEDSSDVEESDTSSETEDQLNNNVGVESLPSRGSTHQFQEHWLWYERQQKEDDFDVRNKQVSSLRNSQNIYLSIQSIKHSTSLAYNFCFQFASDSVLMSDVYLKKKEMQLCKYLVAMILRFSLLKFPHCFTDWPELGPFY